MKSPSIHTAAALVLATVSWQHAVKMVSSFTVTMPTTGRPTTSSSSSVWRLHSAPPDTAEAPRGGDDDDVPVAYDVPYEPASPEELMYALGVNLARQLGDVRPLVEDGNELAQVAKGILDCVVGRIDDTVQQDLLRRRGEELNNVIVSRADTLRQRIEDMGRNMLQQMADAEGTETLQPSGVVLHPLEAGPDGFGAGVRPTLASSVKVHYHGTLPDGTVFDSSLGKEPVTFAVQQVIPGWKEGLLRMHEGETAMLGIPPEAGYGAEGTPDGRIPGGATLFFKVQLLEVLSGGIGGSPSLLGADGKKLGGSDESSGGGSGLLGPDGLPMF